MRWLDVGTRRNCDRLHPRRCPNVAGGRTGDAELPDAAWKVDQPLESALLWKGLGPDDLQKFIPA